MPGITFVQLPRELRDMIWLAAAAVQYEHITSGMPTSCKVPCTTRRPFIIDGEELVPDPNSTKSKPYTVRLYHSRDQDKLRVGMNDIQTLVNCLPMATVNSEARSHATTFCRSQVKFVHLYYEIDIDNKSSDTRDEILQQVFVQPTTVMITTAEGTIDCPDNTFFDSAEHLVNVINRVCGSGVEHIICDAWAHTSKSIEDVYWPHTLQSALAREDMDPFFQNANFVNGLKHAPFDIVMTPERTLYIEEELRHEDNLKQLSFHLLKFHEILDASKQQLPRLRSVEVELETPCNEEVYFTGIKAEIQDSDLCVNFKMAQLHFGHDFVKDIYGDRWGAFYTELRKQKLLRGEQVHFPAPLGISVRR